eukprot:COSAG04_NODE_3184_length_3078_cov_2.507553_2_plen_107_part_00
MQNNDTLVAIDINRHRQPSEPRGATERVNIIGAAADVVSNAAGTDLLVGDAQLIRQATVGREIRAALHIIGNDEAMTNDQNARETERIERNVALERSLYDRRHAGH